MLKNSILTLCAHVYQEKLVIWIIFSIWSLVIPFSCLLYYFVFFRSYWEELQPWSTGLTSMKRGECWRFLWWSRWAVRKAAMRTMVEIPQKWQNTPSIAFNGRVGEWKQFKKNLKRLIRKSSPQELKRESYPGLLGNLLLDAHLLKFSRLGNNAEKKFFFLIN